MIPSQQSLDSKNCIRIADASIAIPATSSGLKKLFRLRAQVTVAVVENILSHLRPTVSFVASRLSSGAEKDTGWGIPGYIYWNERHDIENLFRKKGGVVWKGKGSASQCAWFARCLLLVYHQTCSVNFPHEDMNNYLKFMRQMNNPLSKRRKWIFPHMKKSMTLL